MVDEQITSVVNKIKQELNTEIYNEMTIIFNNIYEIENDECSSKVIDIMKINNIVKCKLLQASADNLKNDIVNSLTAAIEKKLDADVLSKLEQDIFNQLDLFANNKQTSDTNTDIESKTTNIRNFINNTINTNISNTAIMEARSKIIDIEIQQSEDIKIINLAKAFLDSEVITKVINTVINKLLDSLLIRNHCFKNNGANMTTLYCQTAVVHKDMQNIFDKEMREYCNVIPNVPGSGSGRQKDLTNMELSGATGKTASEIDKLENPICACFDEKLIQKKLSSITNQDKRDTMINNPICFLANCKNDPQAYKKKITPGGDCKITLCSIDISGGENIIQSENVTIKNDCIKDCKKTRCDTLQDQIKSSYFDYDDLNDNNKYIFVALICLIIFLLIFIFYWTII